MDYSNTIRNHFKSSAELKLIAAELLTDTIQEAATLMITCLKQGNKILACGNGGSASDAQHFSAELLNRFEQERQSLPAIALTTDTATITAIANDYSYDEIFSKQITALGKPDDTLLAISTSGNSPSILAATRAAQKKGLRVIALTGKQGGKLQSILTPADINICVPSDSTARIQEVHILIIHCLCDLIEKEFLPNQTDQKEGVSLCETSS